MKSSKSSSYIYEPKSGKVAPCPSYIDAVPTPTSSLTQKTGTRFATQRYLSEDGSAHQRRTSRYSLTSTRKSDRIWKSIKQKSTIRVLSLANAVLSWLVTMLGYFVIAASTDEESARVEMVKVTVVIISVFQATLVALKWKYNEDYMTIVRSALKLRTCTVMNQEPVIFEKYVRRLSMHRCVWESLFHLVAFIPHFKIHLEFTVFGINSQCSLDEVLFLLIVVRNYHTLQFLFWYSRMSEIRTHLLSRVIGVQVTRGFIFRCFMAFHSYKIILVVMCFIVLIPGLIEYTFANVSFLTDYYTIWSEYWVISITQAPVGYGDSSPNTLFGEVSLLISCFTGISLLGLTTSITKNNLDLNLTECNLYSELLYMRRKRWYQLESTKMIQKWWRLILMRNRKRPHPFVIIEFYTYLREFRGVITKCQKIKDNRFERQITAIEESTHKAFHPLNEYLSPLRFAHGFVSCTQVQDILRTQYRIYTVADQIANLARRNWRREARVMSSLHIRSPRRVRPVKVHSRRVLVTNGQPGLVKARLLAMQNAKGRLAHGVTFTNLG